MALPVVSVGPAPPTVATLDTDLARKLTEIDKTKEDATKAFLKWREDIDAEQIKLVVTSTSTPKPPATPAVSSPAPPPLPPPGPIPSGKLPVQQFEYAYKLNRLVGNTSVSGAIIREVSLEFNARVKSLLSELALRNLASDAKKLRDDAQEARTQVQALTTRYQTARDQVEKDVNAFLQDVRALMEFTKDLRAPGPDLPASVSEALGKLGRSDSSPGALAEVLRGITATTRDFVTALQMSTTATAKAKSDYEAALAALGVSEFAEVQRRLTAATQEVDRLAALIQQYRAAGLQLEADAKTKDDRITELEEQVKEAKRKESLANAVAIDLRAQKDEVTRLTEANRKLKEENARIQAEAGDPTDVARTQAVLLATQQANDTLKTSIQLALERERKLQLELQGVRTAVVASAAYFAPFAVQIANALPAGTEGRKQVEDFFDTHKGQLDAVVASIPDVSKRAADSPSTIERLAASAPAPGAPSLAPQEPSSRPTVKGRPSGDS